MAWKRRGGDPAVEKELAYHLERLTEDLIAQGLSPEEARRRARIEFGGARQAAEACGDLRPFRWLEELAQDTRYALRSLRKSPGFTTVALLSLALGIGANTSIFTLLDRLLLQMLPVPQPEQIQVLRRAGMRNPIPVFSYPLFEEMRNSSSVPMGAMSSIATLQGRVGAGEAEPVRTQLVSGEWFPTLGVAPALGRLLTPADNREIGGHPVAVLSHSFWERRFGSDPRVLAQTLAINGARFTIVGVAARGFEGATGPTSTPQVWIPLMMQREVRYRGNVQNIDGDDQQPWAPQWQLSWLEVLARLEPGAPLPAGWHAAVRADRDRLFKIISDPADRAPFRNVYLEAVPAGQGISNFREQIRRPLLVLMATVATVLLIACANLANLLLARGLVRQRELAVRLSLGASRGRLIRQLLTESVLLAVGGALLGLGVAQWGSEALARAALGSRYVVEGSVFADARVLAFTAAIAVATGLLFGLFPALRFSRPDIGSSIKSGARSITGGLPFGRVLVSGQVALSLTLLVTAILLARSLQNLNAIDTGYEREHLITAQIDLRSAGYETAALPAYYARVLERVRALPGVRSASISLAAFLGGSVRSSSIDVRGRTLPPGAEKNAVENMVASQYFETVGLPIRRGRGFGPQDTAASPKVVVVNERFARHFFGGEDPVGRRVGYGQEGDGFEIIGLIPDVKVTGLRDETPRMMYHYLPQQTEPAGSIDVRAAGDPRAVIALLRPALLEIDPNVPIRDIVTVGELADRTLASSQLLVRLTVLFGLLAVSLASLGLFGVMSYNVSRRAGELGLRMALGATPGRVLSMVFSESARLVAAGLVAGALLSVWVTGSLGSLLYGLTPRDPATLLSAGTLLAAVAAAAVAWPALRAARVDPMVALRQD